MATARFETLGCRLNQADSALMTGLLQSIQIEVVSDKDTCDVDVVVVNTCGVTATASRKSKQAFRRIRNRYPNACVIVTGCGVNIDYDGWSNEEGVDIALRPTDRAMLPQRIQDFWAHHPQTATASCCKHFPGDGIAHTEFSEGSRSVYPFKSRAFLKIQDGCNNFCSYCIVPYARGAERSRNIDEIILDFQGLLADGHQEIILAGVNTSTFRWDGGGLSDLIRKLVEIQGNFRIRLSSAEPHEEIRKVIDLMCEFPEKICRFLHLPAQHLTDKILKSMNRPYNLESYLSYIQYAREKVPDIHIGTDIIVGFPGETPEDFELMCQRVQDIGYSNIHVFPFSPREGTVAEKMQQNTSQGEIAQRAEVLGTIAHQLAIAYAETQKNKPCTILVEQVNAQDEGIGWSDHYIRGIVPASLSPKRHQLIQVEALSLVQN